MKNHFNKAPGEESDSSTRKGKLYLTRREALKAGLAGGAAGASFLAGPIVWEKGWDTLGKDELIKTIAELEIHFLKRYGIPVEIAKPGKRILSNGMSVYDNLTSYRALDKKSLYTACKSLEGARRALSLYPPDKIGKFVKSIEIVERLWVGLGEVGGVAHRDSTPSSKIHIALEPENVFSSHEAVLGGIIASRSIHHEIAHAVMKNVTAEEWSIVQPSAAYQEEKWSKAQPKAIEGFARDYGSKNYAEDMATTAELMFPKSYVFEKLNDSYPLDTNPLKNPTVQKKIAFLKDKYETHLGMGKEYWKDLDNGAVDEEYWNARQRPFHR